MYPKIKERSPAADGSFAADSTFANACAIPV